MRLGRDVVQEHPLKRDKTIAEKTATMIKSNQRHGARGSALDISLARAFRRGAIALCFFLQTFDGAISAAAVAIAVLGRRRRHWLWAQTHAQPNSHAAVCFLFDQQFDRPRP